MVGRKPADPLDTYDDFADQTGSLAMPFSRYMLVALLIVVQAWVAVMGGSAGDGGVRGGQSVGCVRLWACLSEHVSPDDEGGCACCRGERDDSAPAPDPARKDHDPGCCVTLPDMAAFKQRHDAASELAGLLNCGVVAAVLAEMAWTPEACHGDAATWSPPPDPGTRRTATGLPSTRLLI